MEWEKVGLIFDPKILEHRGLTCALMPIVELIDFDTDLVRIYFAPRDNENRSQLECFEININNPTEILNISTSPILTYGKTGTFDDSGMTPGSFSTIGNDKVYYYTGWNLTKNVPFNNSIGVAKLGDNNKFTRFGDGPIMTRSLHEPYSCASPFVLKEENIYRMWYASMDSWESTTGEQKHFYNLKYAESNDGINWNREGKIVIDYNGKDEYAFGRPFVLREEDIYKMWYSVRGGLL